MTDYDPLALILVPAFVLGLQKYIEVRASYSPPTTDDISKIKSKSGNKSARFVRNIPVYRIILLAITIFLALIFVFSKASAVGWIALGGVLVCILALSVLVNWQIIYKV